MSSTNREHLYSINKGLHSIAANPNDAFFHQVIAEVEDYAVFLMDPAGMIITWNKGAEKIKGYTASEIIGKSFKVFYLADDVQKKLPDRLLETARLSGKANHEGWRVRKDGSRFWGSVAITAVHSDTGDVIAFLKVTRDLTERKLADDLRLKFIEDLTRKNEELRKSEERYHNMVAEVEDYAIILLDENGVVLDWNLGAEKLKGYTAAEIVGQHFEIFYLPSDRMNGVPMALLKEAAQKGKVSHEGWRLKKDGAQFWGSVAITALHGVGGEIIGYTKVTRDLTERKNAEESLRAKAEELLVKNKAVERLNEELSSFTYVASHDLKEPLRKIATFSARLAQEEALSENGKTYIAKVRDSALRMQNLIHDLLLYSQIAHQRASFEDVDLNEIVQQVIVDLELSIAEKNAIINKGTLPIIRGIRFQFHQVFLNLLLNALKYSRENVRPQISISASVMTAQQMNLPGDGAPRYHHIAVKDNGIGFPPEFSDKIFTPFQRLHSRHDVTGSGIGLAIVKRVVGIHGGVVRAEGQPDTGATFHLFLPEVNR